MRVLLTGASGFVGSHVLNYLLLNTDAEIVCLVSFQHRGTSARIREIQKQQFNRTGDWAFGHRVTVLPHDLTAPIDPVTAHQIGPVDVIMNVASDSHVERSITNPRGLVENNIKLMITMLEYARAVKPKLFLQMSTDEVYGAAPQGHNHREWETHLPSNPYSASKSAQESMTISYWRTYGVPVVITNTMNIFGEMQDQEKFPAMIIKKVLTGETVTVHASPKGTMGSRFYLHAYNLADAWWFLTKKYIGGEWTVPAYDSPDDHDRPDRWNIVGEREVDNLEFAEMIAEAIGKPLVWKAVDFHSSRPGHDLRYALDGAKLGDAGWKAPFSLQYGIERLVEWSLANPEWHI